MPSPISALLDQIVPELAKVPGVVAVVLGGSRARGTANAASDYDLGLYFGPGKPLDTEYLRNLVMGMVDDPLAAVLTPVGTWGPRIIGGGWLSIAGQKVDLLYRDSQAVAASIDECRSGRISIDYQPGHPHGFCSSIWMGEIALCQPLHDPCGIIAELKSFTSPYPDNLRSALLNVFLWEVSFSIDIARTALSRNDQTHVAGCTYRALCCIAQVLFALNGRYLINEKAALQEAGGFAHTLPDLATQVESVWAAVGVSDLSSALSILKAMDNDLHSLVKTLA